MRIKVATLAVVLTGTLGATVAYGEDRIVAVWDCELKEGKTAEDAQAVNGKWVALANRAAGGDVRSFIATAIVGDSRGFRYFDSFPSLDAWVAVQKVMRTDEGQAVEAQFEGVASCVSSSLYNAEESG